MKKIPFLMLASFLAGCGNTAHQTADAQRDSSGYYEPHRPQIHFSPKAHWMNDPNGMVFSNGTYHLFFQHNPDSSVWGPMHWGHATSPDLVHWREQPIALFPDSTGTIFSGSAIADKNNTSGFGINGKTPLVAIFTQHNPEGAKANRTDFQTQSIAYSLDEGKTWTKYSGNPVLKNPGIRDFRDPKVTWFENTKRWIMTLATSDHITFYSSPDLKAWTKESEFGKGLGAHGGVWECPDLIQLYHHGDKVCVLIVNLNPGGPNQGSATQYFTGKFDGRTFTTDQSKTKWIDYGPDEYAGITWSNTGDRRIFLGWMSNWMYAERVPTEKWRSAMTIPRELSLEKTDSGYLVASKPVQELDKLAHKAADLNDIDATSYNLSGKAGKLSGPARIDLTADTLRSFTLTLFNKSGEKVDIGYDRSANNYFIDRSRSGMTDFNKQFAAKHTAPRFTQKPGADITLVIDDASVELFADGGLTVMTSIFFPNTPYTDVQISSSSGWHIKSLRFSKLERIW